MASVLSSSSVRSSELLDHPTKPVNAIIRRQILEELVPSLGNLKCIRRVHPNERHCDGPSIWSNRQHLATAIASEAKESWRKFVHLILLIESGQLGNWPEYAGRGENDQLAV